MFLVRLAFWVGLIVLLLPTDERQQARLYETATNAVERTTTFCERNARVCVVTADLWATFLKKAEFGGRLVIDLASRRWQEEPQGLPTQPAAIRNQPAGHGPARGTLQPSDLAPPWRGQVQRTGT
jgi:hypothetical protein